MAKKKTVHEKVIREVVERPAKKKTRKKTAKKKTKKKSSSTKTLTEYKMERILIENFVSLQKVMVKLSTKFEDLSSQISKLLNLFEVSAKALAEKDLGTEKANKETGEISKKMDTMLDQNRTIARGLTLVHERIDEEHPGLMKPMPPMNFAQPSPRPPITQRPPTQNMQNKMVPHTMPSQESKERTNLETPSQGPSGEYHKSIYSEKEKP